MKKTNVIKLFVLPLAVWRSNREPASRPKFSVTNILKWTCRMQIDKGPRRRHFKTRSQLRLRFLDWVPALRSGGRPIQRHIDFMQPFIYQRGASDKGVIGASRINDLLCLRDTLCSAAALRPDCRTPFVTMVADGHCNKGTCSRSVPAIKPFLFWRRASVSCHCDAGSRHCYVSAGSIICSSVCVFEARLTAFVGSGEILGSFLLFF